MSMTFKFYLVVGKFIACVLVASALSSCASDGTGGVRSAPAGEASGRIQNCKSTDQQVPNRQQCLQDDAACYQISNGNWCTGERGNTCPAGSSTLPTGDECPAGKRCFRISESLECMI